MSTRIDVDLSVIGLMGDKLYSQSRMVVFMREVLQNAIDAESNRIDVLIQSSDNQYIITVKDNGTGINDFQKYFLTIGGSTKRDNGGTIGGFGIAKLSIMSMDNWSIRSQDGYVNKDILMTGGDIQHENSISMGTIVCAQCPQSFSDYSKVESILKLIQTKSKILITFNGEEVIPYDITHGEFAGEEVNYVEDIGTYEGYMIVRLNGLFMFADRLYLNSDQLRDNLYIHDLESHLSPYDDNYPLNANREEVTSQDDISRIHTLKNALNRADGDNQRIEELSELNIREYKDYLLAGTLDKESIKSISPFIIKTWRRYIDQLHTFLDIHEDYRIGLSNIESSRAFRYSDNKGVSYFINPDCLNSDHDKGRILACAIHEISHYYESSHYEEYATRNTQMTADILNAIQAKKFRW